MATYLSIIAAAQALALVKGPSAGSHAPASAVKLSLLDDALSMPAATYTAADKFRFGKVPRGAKIIPHLTSLQSGHSVLFAGTLVFTPLSGNAAPTAIACVANIEGTEVASMLDMVTPLTVAEDSWVDWVPGGSLVLAGTVAFNLRLVYGTAY